jgi:phospho-N-acetylmuramoyl-pentapeptide-transferase
MTITILQVLVPAVLAFFVGIIATPAWTNYLYRRAMWKKKAGKYATTGEEAIIFNSLHDGKEVGTPRLGGVLIWSATIFTALIVWLAARLTSWEPLDLIEYISRSETWIPLATLGIGAFIGLVDDVLEIRGSKDDTYSKGLSFKMRLALVGAIGLAVGYWFFVNLDVEAITLPFLGSLQLGFLIVPVFALIMMAIYCGGVIDGLDGLSGGVFAIMFSAYAVIAFFQMQGDLAALCATLVGAILAFLWFNIPPARFYMSETGSMALTVTLAVVAFMADELGSGKGIAVLPIIAAPLLITAASSFIQIASKKLRKGKKVFLVAPLHHHFEALGWPAYKVVMRYWIITVMFAFAGIIVALTG